MTLGGFGSGNDRFDGKMGEFLLFNRALTTLQNLQMGRQTQTESTEFEILRNDPKPALESSDNPATIPEIPAQPLETVQKQPAKRCDYRRLNFGLQ